MRSLAAVRTLKRDKLHPAEMFGMLKSDSIQYSTRVSQSEQLGWGYHRVVRDASHSGIGHVRSRDFFGVLTSWRYGVQSWSPCACLYKCCSGLYGVRRNVFSIMDDSGLSP